MTRAHASSEAAGGEKKRVVLSWSSGKDAAWTLHTLRRRPDVEVVGLLTTLNEEADRVAMHAVRRTLLEAQARAAGLPLWQIPLPYPCPNAVYEERMRTAIDRARNEGVSHFAFGDLFLEDIRDYRIRQLSNTGIEPLFPIWRSSEETPRLAQQMIQAGIRATVTCVDPKQLPERFAGREFDQSFLSELPDGVDPCGENGEFHTFCYSGPTFSSSISIQVGEIVTRDGFCFADLVKDGDGLGRG